MGGNIARRLIKAGGHECGVATCNAERASKRSRGDGATAAGSLAELYKALGDKPRAVWVMLPAGRITEETVERSRRPAAAGRHHHRRRQLLLQGRHPPRQKAWRRRHSLRRLRHVRRRVGDRARLLPDDRRREGGRGSSRPDLRGARARAGDIPRTPGRERVAIAAPSAATFTPAQRRRALRQDGA